MDNRLFAIARRLGHPEKQPSLRVTLWSAFVLGLLTTLVYAWDMLQYPSRHLVSGVLLLTAWLVTIIAPAIIAIASATMTAQDVTSDSYDLLRLTDVPAESIMQGYILAALTRLRWLLALVIGLMPVIALSLIDAIIQMAAVFCQVIACNPMMYYGADCTCGAIRFLPAGVLPLIVAVVGLLGVNILAATLGTWLAFAFRRPRPAGSIAMPVTVVLTGAALAGLYLSSGWVVIYDIYPGSPLVVPGLTDKVIMLASAFAVLVVPPGLSALIIRVARRWV